MTDLTCPNCGHEFTPRSHNQRCCSKMCRQAHERRKREIAKQQQGPIRRRCDWCRVLFDAATARQRFCCDQHQQAYSNWCKGWAVRVVDAVLAWRYRGRKTGLTEICQTAAALWRDLKKRQKQAAQAAGPLKTEGAGGEPPRRRAADPANPARLQKTITTKSRQHLHRDKKGAQERRRERLAQ